MPGVRFPGRETGDGNVLSTLSRNFCDALLRMQVELQTLYLVVAGSSPAGPIQGDRSSVVRARCFTDSCHGKASPFSR